MMIKFAFALNNSGRDADESSFHTAQSISFSGDSYINHSTLSMEYEHWPRVTPTSVNQCNVNFGILSKASIRKLLISSTPLARPDQQMLRPISSNCRRETDFLEKLENLTIEDEYNAENKTSGPSEGSAIQESSIVQRYKQRLQKLTNSFRNYSQNDMKYKQFFRSFKKTDDEKKKSGLRL